MVAEKGKGRPLPRTGLARPSAYSRAPGSAGRNTRVLRLNAESFDHSWYIFWWHLLVGAWGNLVRLVKKDEGTGSVWAHWPDALGVHRSGGFPVVC